MFPLDDNIRILICMPLLSPRRTHSSIVIPGVAGVILTLAGTGTMRGRAAKVFTVLLGVAGGQSRHRVKALLVSLLGHFAVPPLGPGLAHWL